MEKTTNKWTQEKITKFTAEKPSNMMELYEELMRAIEPDAPNAYSIANRLWIPVEASRPLPKNSTCTVDELQNITLYHANQDIDPVIDTIYDRTRDEESAEQICYTTKAPRDLHSVAMRLLPALAHGWSGEKVLQLKEGDVTYARILKLAMTAMGKDLVCYGPIQEMLKKEATWKISVCHQTKTIVISHAPEEKTIFTPDKLDVFDKYRCNSTNALKKWLKEEYVPWKTRTHNEWEYTDGMASHPVTCVQLVNSLYQLTTNIGIHSGYRLLKKNNTGLHEITNLAEAMHLPLWQDRVVAHARLVINDQSQEITISASVYEDTCGKQDLKIPGEYVVNNLCDNAETDTAHKTVLIPSRDDMTFDDMLRMLECLFQLPEPYSFNSFLTSMNAGVQPRDLTDIMRLFGTDWLDKPSELADWARCKHIYFYRLLIDHENKRISILHKRHLSQR